MRTQKSKHKIPNTNKGITLIALVITIIVMLILVAVTITMAVNGGLFEYAGRAGTKTNQAVANEQEFANLEANMTVNQLIDKYTVGIGGNATCTKCADGYITGYVCNNYGVSCNVVNSGYNETYRFQCKDCGFNNVSSSYTGDIMNCPGCGIQNTPQQVCQMSECLHLGDSVKQQPQIGTYPCQDCKYGDTYISFTYNDHFTYGALKGLTWDEWFLTDDFKSRNYMFRKTSDGSIYSDVDADCLLIYDDGTVVKSGDLIREGYDYQGKYTM